MKKPLKPSPYTYRERLRNNRMPNGMYSWICTVSLFGNIDEIRYYQRRDKHHAFRIKLSKSSDKIRSLDLNLKYKRMFDNQVNKYIR